MYRMYLTSSYFLILGSVLCLLMYTTPNSQAQTITLAGFNFDVEADVDDVLIAPGGDPYFRGGVAGCGSVTNLPGLTQAESAVFSLTDDAFDIWMQGIAIVDLLFLDNVVVNDPGPDLAVFEIGGAEPFALAVFNPGLTSFRTYGVSSTGFTVQSCGNNTINVALIDLDDFGVAPGGQISMVRLHTLGTAPGCCSGADIAEVWAINSAPNTISVLIDIKPGSDPNSINLGANGVIPVAILSSAEFDATQVDPETILLAGSGVAVRGKGNKFLAHTEDVNGDGLDDLVLQVETENLDAGQFQDGFAILTGETFGGQAIEGSDTITIVPPE